MPALVVCGDGGDRGGVERRLAQLGLPPDGLEQVCAAGAGGYASTTGFHPKAAPGTYLYNEATAALRRLLLPRGWRYDEAGGQPRTFNTDLGVSIVVLSGDEHTGRALDREPRSRHPKGQATAKSIGINGQLEIFAVSRPTEPETSGLHTWVLLLAAIDGELRAELSRPERMDDGGRVSGWTERILLADQTLGGFPDFDVRGPGQEDPGSDFSVTWQK